MDKGKEQPAYQISKLVSEHNNMLYSHYDVREILENWNEHLLEVVEDKVVGVIRLQKQAYSIAEIQHLAVHPDYRKKGIGIKLVLRALFSSPCPFIYATIREDNKASQRTFEKCEFRKIGSYQTDKRILYLYITTAPLWRKRNECGPLIKDVLRRLGK